MSPKSNPLDASMIIIMRKPKTENDSLRQRRKSWLELINSSFHQSMTTRLFILSFLIISSLISETLCLEQQKHVSHPLVKRASSNNGTNGSEYNQALNYLLFSRNSNKQQPIDLKLIELLKDSNHSHVSDAINLQLANSVWKQMRQNALEFAQQRANEAKPTINRLLEQANVSANCRQSLNDVLVHLANLDNWAVQMYNAFGDFPATGFFEGSHTSMGSYHQCVNLDPNQWIGKAQYCSFKFQPIIPKRPKFHNLLATIDNLANFTSKDDMFYQVAKKAHYFYYTKLRLATCMPSKCEQNDLELLGKQVAVNTFLQYSGVSCLEKQDGFNPDGAQIFSLTILIMLASISVFGTLVHILNLRTFFVSDISSRGHFSSYQAVVVQQQTLLAPNQQKSPMLPPPVVGIKSSSENNNFNGSLPLEIGDTDGDTTTTATTTTTTASSSQMRISRSLNAKLLYILDVLVHFSIVKNGKKLFDTSTSRPPGNSRTSSIVSGMKDQGSTTNADGSSNKQQSDCSSSLSGPARSYDISCVHGLRFWTISWIIFGHTMQYTEWAGFGRAYQVEQNIVSFFLQPLLNATFSVDTFFLISGLLTTYVTWSLTRGQYKRLNKFAFLISRYLRLTPQVLLVILLFIIFPMMGDGPYWRGLIQKESDNCKQNWWVSALYLQAFIKQDRICNLVTWWLSIEMFYHFVSIIVIIALLHSTRKGIFTATIIGGGLTAISCYLHYVNHYPPNMLPTLLQRYEIWDSIVLKYFWTPFPHAASYFVGLLLGYALYNRSVTQLSRAQVRYGWLAFTFCYLSILFGTYNWNNNAPYSRLSATLYYNLAQVFWSLSTAWAILACSLGHGGWINGFLSSPIFVPLGRATYMTYLSHMLIVMAYPAKMNLLIEPSYVVFLYIFISNLFLSYLLGIFLTLVYESPILHLQKLIVTKMGSKFNEDTPSNNKLVNNDNNNTINNDNNNNNSKKGIRVALYAQQQATPEPC